MCPVSPDLRAVRTRNRLRGAVLDLLRTQSWDDITVADVVAHARCSRSTFYAHYDDRDALLRDAFLGAMDIVPATGDDNCLSFVPGLFEHLAHHRVLAEPYLVQGHAGPMVQALRERILIHVRERIDASAPHLVHERRAELAAAVAGAVWAAVLWWLEQGRDVAPVEAADAVLKLLSPGLGRVACA
ncbi:MAG TPA: TetR family transcriptional regulator [Propionicimonas sp.]